MKKIHTLIDRLKTKGVEFSLPLTPAEIQQAQKRYGLSFAPDWVDLLRVAMPISSGFYDWRNEDPSYIRNIQARQEWLLDGILFDVQTNDFWLPQWGEQPAQQKQALQIVRTHFAQAPKLFPIYGHRFMSSLPTEHGTPVFSVMQTDIIYYGVDLWSYLEIEFGLRDFDQQNWKAIKHIPFWSDFCETSNT